MKLINCPKCNGMTDGEKPICVRCGASTQGGKRTERTNHIQGGIEGEICNEAIENSESMRINKSKKNKIIIGICVLAIILVAALILTSINHANEQKRQRSAGLYATYFLYNELEVSSIGNLMISMNDIEKDKHGRYLVELKLVLHNFDNFNTQYPLSEETTAYVVLYNVDTDKGEATFFDLYIVVGTIFTQQEAIEWMKDLSGWNSRTINEVERVHEPVHFNLQDAVNANIELRERGLK